MAQDMVRVKCGSIPFINVCSPEYLRHTPAIKTVGYLKLHRCVDTRNLNRYGRFGMRRALNIRYGHPAIMASTGLAQLELALAGVGPGLINALWLAEMLADCSITPTDFEGTAWLLYPNRSFLPTK
jgi:DNA-binding transcriptional LysR family regulator